MELAKGGLFRVGPMNKGDGIARLAVMQPKDGEGRELTVRRLQLFWKHSGDLDRQRWYCSRGYSPARE